MSDFKLPTEIVDLPSQGYLYPENNPLSEGKIEMKYMTAEQEDILTNQSYIENGTVIDKLLQSLIVTKINYNDLLIGDKNALTIASRILGYGKNYEFEYGGEKETVDLTTIENKPFKKKLYEKGVNSFKFILPQSGTELTFKLLTQGDEIKINNEFKGLKKLGKNVSKISTTRLAHSITSINGNDSQKIIREFINNYFLVQDIRAFRKYITKISPDVDLTFVTQDGGEIEVPIGLNFFWPDI